MINLYCSNQAEILLEQLCQKVKHPPGNPFQPEYIVVENRGMATWLSCQLSQKLGVWANFQFPFLQRILETIFKAIMQIEDIHEILIDRDEWLFLIMAEISGAEKSDYKNIYQYIHSDSELQIGLKSFQLSKKIAQIFYSYSLLRPELLEKWSQDCLCYHDEDEKWQQKLFKKVITKTDKSLISFLIKKLKEYPKVKGSFKDLPQRIALFGISNIPRAYLDILNVLSSYIEINLFIFAPVEPIWHDFENKGEIYQKLEEHKIQSHLQVNQIELGSPLMTSLGSIVLDFHYQLVKKFSLSKIDKHFQKNLDTTILGSIQNSILTGKSVFAATTNSEQDDSICIHSCHSRLREIEVMKDQLLDLLNYDENLEAHEIVVMAPDIEEYVPFIDAVLQQDEPAKIPFSIADRPIQEQSVLFQAFFYLLSLKSSRLTVTEVFDLLSFPIVYQHFNITSENIRQLKNWIQQLDIRWGIDKEHKKQRNQIDSRQHSWLNGLKRAYLGYAFGNESDLIHQNLPFTAIEGSAILTLGKFTDYCEKLFFIIDKLELDHPHLEWKKLFQDMMTLLFADTQEYSLDRERLFSLINDFSQFAIQSQLSAPLDVQFTKTFF
ncbi:MAG: exodeoxyribonuclease V subunit gamma, partial [Spirochaetes bacterium]|nr:exodeoxyribonuclease V subunit gamma [Spirochaetota bacterium]